MNTKVKLLLAWTLILLSGCVSSSEALPPSPKTAAKTLQRIYGPTLKAQNHASGLMAGTAKVEITPPVGTPLAGYSRRKGKPSKGMHDPLYARVLILQNETNRAVFVSCDLMAINEELYDKVLQRINTKYALRKEQFFLFATHTHSGSGGLGKGLLEKMVTGRHDRALFYQTAVKIADAIYEASARMEPASMNFSRGDLKGMIENRMIKNGPVDPEFCVLNIQGKKGALAFLVNLAVHPTILGPNNMLFSAEFPGALAETVETARPGSVCLVANAAGGDQRVQGFTEYQSFDKVQEVGETFAKSVLETTSSSPARTDIKLLTLQSYVKLPPVKIHYGWLRLPSFFGNRLLDRNVPVNSAVLDDILFMSIPGEMTSGIGMEIKERAKENGFQPFLIGYANDYIAYIIPENYYDSDAYEADVTFFGRTLDHYFKELYFGHIAFLKRYQNEKLRAA